MKKLSEDSVPKFIFVSNYISHHQIPFCNCMYELLKGDFAFVQTEPMEQERINMGWAADSELPYLVKYYENPDLFREWIDTCKVVFFGGTDDESYIQFRLVNGLPVIRYSERLYKTGQWKAVSPRGLCKKYLDHTRYRKEPVYMMCSGAYVPSDFGIVKAYPGKMLKWGYFPEMKHYDVDKLMQEKAPRSILWAARMIDWKHPELVVETAKYLKDKNLSFHMDVIGGGELEDFVKELVAKYELEDVLTLHGFKKPEEVREYMEKASIYLVTSDRNEGWGAVVNEAMNSGCAVVGNHMIGAVPYLIKHGETGYIYQDKHPENLFDLVETLLENPQTCETMGRKAMESIAKEWNPSVAAKRLVALALRLGFLSAEDATLADEEKEIPLSGPGSVAEIISERRMYGKLVN